ncbi:MAG: hypothetical protein KQH59_17525 [Desulfobulbaceae bacterium]|nr:hypothetical protein [Desulfobulbaceae bacterium]
MDTSRDIRFQDASFAEFLLKSSIVKPGSEPHLVRWVGLFFRLRCKWQNYLWHEQLEFFLGHLKNERIIPRWQVVQAEQAVRLYFVHFLGSSTEPKSLVEIDEQGMFDTASSLQQLVTTLRLKRYARRTEKIRRDIGDMKEALRGQQRRRLPVVLLVSETQRLLGQFEGTVSPLDRLGDHGCSSVAVSGSQ